ncbi:hypothetical protein ElyMa_006971900 [Elysia marginata]|uniref:SAP domain-containing protein n=1 Tax=Elysia marginata TaxID=1093978 RepID=A0AAV4JMU4_9GAST|nr:hypothetical protein ElyMa_006971900 [Elysia marginata]
MTVSQLKVYLKDNGQNQRGRKEELVKRAQATEKLLQSKPRSTITNTTGPGHSGGSLDRSIEAKEKHSFVQSLTVWKEVNDVAVEEWPMATDKELYNYLLYLQRRAKKQVKAKNFYDCRHVHSINSEHSIGKADGAIGVLSQAMSQAAADERSIRNASDLYAWCKNTQEIWEGQTTSSICEDEASTRKNDDIKLGDFVEVGFVVSNQ